LFHQNQSGFELKNKNLIKMKQGIYILQKEDLLSAVRTVLSELKRSGINPDTSHPEISDRLSQKEAAELIGISQPTILAWKKKKLIPYYQIGHKVFYSRKELIEAAQKNSELRRA
jgi:excisionase family DNA binding protein